MAIDTIYGPENEAIYAAKTNAPGPDGKLPVTADMLINRPSGDIFGLTLNAGMGWQPEKLNGAEVLVIGNAGGIRGEDGKPVALGLHVGHYETPLQFAAAAREVAKAGGVPYAAFVTDPCDGRTQGTTGMFDSLPYRNDAAIVMRRLIRSTPVRRAVIGVASCDKGLPAVMMALANQHDLATVLVPGGATLQPSKGEDLGKVQTIGARFANGELTLDEAAELGCKACGSAGGGCQFLGTAGTSQVVSEGLGLALPHSALAPSGSEVWLEVAPRLGPRRARHAGARHHDEGHPDRQGDRERHGRPRRLRWLDQPAAAHPRHRPCRRRAYADRRRLDGGQSPRAASRLGAAERPGLYHPTVRAFMAGGVPEVMLHLRKLGLLHEDVLTVNRPDAEGKPRLVGRLGASSPLPRDAQGAGRRRAR